jgi:hypothetical protein
MASCRFQFNCRSNQEPNLNFTRKDRLWVSDWQALRGVPRLVTEVLQETSNSLRHRRWRVSNHIHKRDSVDLSEIGFALF